MKRLLLLLLVFSLLLCVVSCNGQGDSSITFLVNEEVMMFVNTDEAGEVKLSLPDSGRAPEFVGWRAKKGEGTIFLPAGAIYRYEQGEKTAFEPVYVSGSVSSQVGMAYEPDAHGITMSALINTAEWEALGQLSSAVSCGMLIALKSDLDAVGGIFTHSAFAAASAAAHDITALSGVADGGMTEFTALLTNIPAENYAQFYTGVAYANITYTDGSTGYYYFPYGAEGAPLDSVRNVAGNKRKAPP